jgi:transposase-like protein
MAVIQVDTEILKQLIKESVQEAIKSELQSFLAYKYPEVSDEEMKDIIETYGEVPKEEEMKDYTN